MSPFIGLSQTNRLNWPFLKQNIIKESILLPVKLFWHFKTKLSPDLALEKSSYNPSTSQVELCRINGYNAGLKVCTGLLLYTPLKKNEDRTPDNSVEAGLLRHVHSLDTRSRCRAQARTKSRHQMGAFRLTPANPKLRSISATAGAGTITTSYTFFLYSFPVESS